MDIDGDGREKRLSAARYDTRVPAESRNRSRKPRRASGSDGGEERAETDSAWHLVSIVRSYYFPPSTPCVWCCYLLFSWALCLSSLSPSHQSSVRILSTPLLHFFCSSSTHVNLIWPTRPPPRRRLCVRVCVCLSLSQHLLRQIPTLVPCKHHHPVCMYFVREPSEMRAWLMLYITAPRMRKVTHCAVLLARPHHQASPSNVAAVWKPPRVSIASKGTPIQVKTVYQFHQFSIRIFHRVFVLYYEPSHVRKPLEKSRVCVDFVYTDSPLHCVCVCVCISPSFAHFYSTYRRHTHTHETRRQDHSVLTRPSHTLHRLYSVEQFREISFNTLWTVLAVASETAICIGRRYQKATLYDNRIYSTCRPRFFFKLLYNSLSDRLFNRP